MVLVGTRQMGEEGFNTLHAGADDETQLARVFGNSFSGYVGQLVPWANWYRGFPSCRKGRDTGGCQTL